MGYRQADTSTLVTIGHVAVAFVLTYLLGFERTLRGAAAGNRTFSVIGAGSAVVAAWGPSSKSRLPRGVTPTSSGCTESAASAPRADNRPARSTRSAGSADAPPLLG